MVLILGEKCKKRNKIVIFCKIFQFLCRILQLIYYICPLFTNNQSKMEKDINRIKVVLADKKKTNKWLAEQLGRDPATVSKWCTNSCQPTLETMMKIAKLLDVELNDLVRLS